MFGEILSGYKLTELLWGKLQSFLSRRKQPEESLATRFVRLLDSHGVHRNQIPRFVGCGLMLKDVQSDESLLAKLDESILQGVCDRLAIRREWLDGADETIYSLHDFYGNQVAFTNFIDDLNDSNESADLRAVLLSPKPPMSGDAVLVLQETIGKIGEKPVYRFHICNAWNFSYWKVRAYLTSCVACAWKRRVYVSGHYADQALIGNIQEGKSLLNWKEDGIWNLGIVNWHPEDMLTSPDAYLKSVDPERDNFGIKSALDLWLSLDEKGYMDWGFDKNFRPLFEAERMKYN